MTLLAGLGTGAASSAAGGATAGAAGGAAAGASGALAGVAPAAAAGAAPAVGAASAASPSFLSNLVQVGQANATGGRFGDTSNAALGLFGNKGLSSSSTDFLNNFMVGGQKLPNYEEDKTQLQPEFMRFLSYLS
jgi:hypothetical protein